MASFSDALKKRLSSELYTKVIDELGDDFDFDLVPRARLNRVIKERNELRDQIGGSSTVTDEFTAGSTNAAGVTTYEPLPRAAQAPAMPGSTPQPAPKGTEGADAIAELERKHAEAIREMSLRFTVLTKLRDAGAVDPELIYNAKLLDLSNVEGEDFKGLDDAIKVLTDNKDRAYLFGQTSGVPAGTGKSGGSIGGAAVTQEAFKAMGYAERLELKEKHPDVYAQLVKTKG